MSTIDQSEDIYDSINEYGFRQTFFSDGSGGMFPVCSCCHAHVMPNRGQGSICDQCDYEAFVEMSHDWD